MIILLISNNPNCGAVKYAIKNNIDYSFISNTNIFDENSYLKENYFRNSKFRKLSKSLISNILKARLDEILSMIKKQISLSGFDFCNNIFITGGGSHLINIEKYFSNFLDLTVNKINDNSSKDNKLENSNEIFNSCLGAYKIVKNGWETEAIPLNVDKNEQKRVKNQ